MTTRRTKKKPAAGDVEPRRAMPASEPLEVPMTPEQLGAINARFTDGVAALLAIPGPGHRPVFAVYSIGERKVAAIQKIIACPDALIPAMLNF